METMMSIHTVADALGVSDKTLRRIVDRGDLRAYKIGGSLRIYERDLAEYLRSAQVRPAPAAPAPRRGPGRPPKSVSQTERYRPGMKVV